MAAKRKARESMNDGIAGASASGTPPAHPGKHQSGRACGVAETIQGSHRRKQPPGNSGPSTPDDPTTREARRGAFIRHSHSVVASRLGISGPPHGLPLLERGTSEAGGRAIVILCVARMKPEQETGSEQSHEEERSGGFPPRGAIAFLE